MRDDERRWRRPDEEDAPSWIEELRRRSHDLAERVGHQEAELRRLRKELRRRNQEMAQLVSHTVIVLALLAAYVIVLTSGGDATGILTALLGYLGGGAVQKVVQSRDASR